MTCFHPLTAYSRGRNPDTGKLIIKFTPPRGGDNDCGELTLPCGQCRGCRLERSRQWAIRCMHEASLHESNCFITLTFSPESLSERSQNRYGEWSLDVVDWQLFMKRFKSWVRYKYGSTAAKKIRFYHCGEYGEMCARCALSIFNCKCGVDVLPVLGRPHYHACIFGFDFPDKEVFKVVNGHPLYTSKALQNLWPYGFSTIGSVTFESAAYCARYIMKKINGDLAENHYFRFDTGEILQPEYTTMSRRPGIARDFIDKYMDDVYPHDFVVVNGKKMRPPRYYDSVLKTERPYTFDDIKYKRALEAEKHLDNNTPERLTVRELVMEQAISLLPRNKEF